MTKPVTRKLAVDALLYRFQLVMGETLPCAICGEPLRPGDAVQFDHHHADVFGGPHEFQNLRPVHYDPCHKRKTKADQQAKAKIDRITGVTCTGPSRKIRSHPFTKNKRKMPKGAKMQSRGFQKPTQLRRKP